MEALEVLIAQIIPVAVAAELVRLVVVPQTALVPPAPEVLALLIQLQAQQQVN